MATRHLKRLHYISCAPVFFDQKQNHNNVLVCAAVNIADHWRWEENDHLCPNVA